MLWQDVRYGLRMLAKSPGFTAVAVLTLAIGISANITMFSVVNAVLLQPLPFEEPDRLVVVQQHNKQHGWTTGFSYPDFLDWRDQNPVFENFAAYTRAEFDLIDAEGAGKIDAAIVSGNFFSMLKTSACLGRVLAEADAQQGGAPVAVISHELWRRRFAEDKAVAGRTITLDDKVYTVVGVLPHAFRYPESLGNAQVWTVLNPGAYPEQKARVAVINEGLAELFWPDADPIGRQLTCCGESYDVIGVAADVIQGNVRIDKPDHAFFPFEALVPDAELRVVVRAQGDGAFVIGQIRAILKSMDETLPLHSVSTFKAQMNKCLNQERFTTTFLAVFAGIALLLIVIGLYGVVSYAVAERTREIGVRMALGARQGSILAMVLKRGLVLSIAGSAAGIVGAICLTRFLSSYLYGVSSTDPLTYAMVPVAIAAVALGACLIPALRAARTDPMAALRCE
jgi:hypothetical protein